jgi:hypothetical protein
MRRLTSLGPYTRNALAYLERVSVHRPSHSPCRLRQLLISALSVLLIAALSPCNAASPASPSKAAAPAPGADPTATSIPSAPVPVCSVQLAMISTDRILRSYTTGDWTALQDELRLTAAGLRATSACAAALPPAARVSFLLVNDYLPQPTVIRILAGDEPPPDFYSKRLIKGPIVTVALYSDRAAAISSAWAASPSPSPVEVGVPQLLASAAGGKKPGPPAFIIATTMTSLPADALKSVTDLLSTPKSTAALTQTLAALGLPEDWNTALKALFAATTVYCDVSITKLPHTFHWGQATVTDTLTTKTLLTPSSIVARATRRFEGAKGFDESISAVSAALASTAPAGLTTEASRLSKVLSQRFRSPETLSANVRLLTQRLSDALATCSCRSPLSPLSNDQASRNACGRQLDKVLAKSIKAIRSDPTVDDPSAEVQSAQVVFEMFAAILEGGVRVDAQTAYVFGALTHASFGLGIGVTAHPNLNHQAKLAPGNVLIDDTPNGVLTSANVYFSCGGYDETTLTPTGNELLPRIVVGIVITPNVGVFGGVNEALPFFRSMSISGGYALMLANIVPSGANIGDVVSTKGSTGTVHGALGAWLLELGYSF